MLLADDCRKAEQTLKVAKDALERAIRVIEAARHRISCPHYHSFPSDVSSGEWVCCNVEAEFQVALLEWDRQKVTV